MPVTDISSFLSTAEFRRLLLVLVGARIEDGTQQRAVDQAIEAYRTQPRLRLLGVERGRQLLGLLGLDVAGDASAEIRHIVVDPIARGWGVGRCMIAEAFVRFGLSTLTAETHRDTVGLYQHCGLDVSGLDEKFPRVERFRCMWLRPR